MHYIISCCRERESLQSKQICLMCYIVGSTLRVIIWESSRVNFDNQTRLIDIQRKREKFSCYFFFNLIDTLKFINKLANPNVKRIKMHNLWKQVALSGSSPHVVCHYDNFWMRVLNFIEFKLYNFFIAHSKKAIKFIRSSCDTISKQAVFPPNSSFQQRYSSHWDKQRSLCDINSSP